MTEESETGELLVSKHELDDCIANARILQERADNYFIENKQLKEALSKVNAGIHKASEMVEGIVFTEDQKMITNLAMDLLKHHPNTIRIKYKGESILEVMIR